MNLTYLLLAVLSTFLLGALNFLCLWLSGKVLIRDNEVIGREFYLAILKISSITAGAALIFYLFFKNYAAIIIIIPLALVLIKYFLGEGLYNENWAQAGMLWLVWLGAFVLSLGILAGVFFMLSRI